MPSFSATAQITGQSEGYSGRTSATIRTARSRNSGGYFPDPRPTAPSSSHEMEPPETPGRFKHRAVACQGDHGRRHADRCAAGIEGRLSGDGQVRVLAPACS
jgi:hypothetical protein